MANSEDTEVLLALVSSLLRNPVNDQALLLDALVRSNGNVEDAVRRVEQGDSEQKSRAKRTSKSEASVKRKRKAVGLDSWLISAEKPWNDPEGPASLAKRPRLKRSSSPVRQLYSTFKPEFVEGSSEGNTSPVKVKAVTQTEFLKLLRPPNSTEAPTKLLPLKFPPLTLTTPELVAKHTPCTMHMSVLPPELACRLFYAMLDESESWYRNKWWLFDRVVESPHRTSFYIRRSPTDAASNEVDMQEAAQYWYNGRPTPPPDHFPPAMEEACKYVEQVVNAELRKRARFPLEWGGDSSQADEGSTEEKILWRANVAASNRYEGSVESVGFHSDQLTYLGPYPTIASLSLGTTRTFRLREVIPTDEKEQRSARTYNIPLAHNSLTIMHASCQEMFKHSIPPQKVIDVFHPPFPPPFKHPAYSDAAKGGKVQDPQTTSTSNARINITFRFYRPDYQPSSIPRCKCGVPCILRPDMKNRYAMPVKGETKKTIVAKYWWTCYAGAQNDGKGCNMWKVMDVKAEGRGPFAGEVDLVPEAPKA